MSHAYRRPIAVTLDAGGAPAAFGWCGVAYRVLAVLGTWHLRDRWWEGEGGASDRTYYRLHCISASGRTELVCEVYCDAAGGRDAWVLERIYD